MKSFVFHLTAIGLMLVSGMRLGAKSSFDIKTADGLKMNIEVCTGKIVHIRMSQTDEFPESIMQRYGIVRSEWPEINARCKEDGRKAVISSGEFSITVNKKDGSFSVSDKDGKSIISSVSFHTSKDEMVGEMGEALNKKFDWCRKRQFIGADPDSYSTMILDEEPEVGEMSKNTAIGIKIADDERFYGGGTSSREHIQHRGEILRIWERARWNEIPIPYLMSSEGWAIYNNVTVRQYYDIGVTDKDMLWLYDTAPHADFYLMFGNSMLEDLDLYTQITGRPMLLPNWAYGASFAGIELENIIDVLNDAARFRDEDIPMDLIWLEPQWMLKMHDASTSKEWNYGLIPGVPKWAKNDRREYENLLPGRLHAMGYRMALWLAIDYDQSVPEEDAIAAAAGKPLSGKEHWMDHLTKFIDQGADGFKLDPGETVSEHSDRPYHNGLTDKEMHNINQVLMPKQMLTTFREHTGRRSYHHYCGGWAGIQHWSASTSGDNGGATVAHFDELNLSMSGYLNTSCDAMSRDEGTTELQCLFQGSLLPWTEINSWFMMDQPWYLSKRDRAAFKYYMQLRNALFPYIYSAAVRGTTNGEPILKAMPLAFPDDRNVDDLTHQYMLGDNLLVGVFSDKIYLPEGGWIDFWSGKRYEGRKQMETIPIPEDRDGYLFIREGAIIPCKPVTQHVTEEPLDSLIIKVYPKGESSYTMYEDDGLTYAYEDGEIARTKMNCKATVSGLNFEIMPVEGKYEGMYGSRKYLVEFHGVSEPASVCVNGKEVPGWSFENGKLSVSLAQEDTGQKVTINCKYGKKAMKVDFDNIEEQSIPSFKGGEKEFNVRMFTDGMNKIMKGRLVPGASIGMHKHEGNSEIMFITKGSGYVIYDGETIPLKAGDVHYCPKGHSHSLVNDSGSDLEFSAVVPQQ